MKTLGERLKIAREYAGLSQEKLGEKAECGQAVVSKIERGDQEKSAYVVQLAVACNVRPEWLAMEEGEMREEVRYSTDPLVNRIVNAMLHLKEEQRGYIVIMAEALTKQDLAENATDAKPTQRPKLKPKVPAKFPNFPQKPNLKLSKKRKEQ